MNRIHVFFFLFHHVYTAFHLPLERNLDVGKSFSDIIHEAQLDQCLITYVTDDSFISWKVVEMPDIYNSQLGNGIFKASIENQEGSVSSYNLTYIQRLLLYHLELSPRCRTLVVVSNKIAFLKSLLDWSYSSNILVWSTRLLVVTELAIQELSPLGNIFSKTNSMILVSENHQNKKSAVVYLHLPYSHRVLQVASWDSRSGLGFASEHRLFPDKFFRLIDGGNLTVVAEDFPPHVRVTEFPEAGEGEPPHIHSGPLIKFLELLAVDINFNYTLVRPPDRAWGYLPPNGSWIGMVGMVFRHEVDFALGPFGITYDRAHAVDYTWPLVGDSVRITAKRGETEVDPWAFVMPLTPTVWAGVFLSLSVSMVLHLLLSMPERDSSINATENWKQYIRVFLQQDIGRGYDYESWERLLLGSWILTILVLLESYCGNLMSLLAVRYVPQPYQSLRAVLDDPKVTMVWEGGTAYVGYFMSAKSGVFRDVAESRKHGRISYIKATEYTDILQTLVMDGDHVLVIEDLALRMLFGEQFTRTGVCNYYLSDETFIHFIYGLVAQKFDPLVDSISERVKAITHSGIYSQWMKTAVPNTTVCLQAPNKLAVQSPLSLRNVWGVFVLLGSGYITSVFVMSLEIVSYKLLGSPTSILEIKLF